MIKFAQRSVTCEGHHSGKGVATKKEEECTADEQWDGTRECQRKQKNTKCLVVYHLNGILDANFYPFNESLKESQELLVVEHENNNHKHDQ